VVQPADASIRLIALTLCQEAIVDAADYELLMARNWYAQWQPRTKSFYAHTWDEGRRTGMGRIVLGLKQGDATEVDHRNGNTLDCRRENLRVATSAQNNQNRKRHEVNRSGFKGVRPSGKKWAAKIYVQGRSIYMGCYATPEEAARQYDAVARLAFGEFARCNFPQEGAG